MHLVLRLAAGETDAFSGHYISEDDDLDALLKECSADSSADQRWPNANHARDFHRRGFAH